MKLQVMETFHFTIVLHFFPIYRKVLWILWSFRHIEPTYAFNITRNNKGIYIYILLYIPLYSSALEEESAKYIALPYIPWSETLRPWSMIIGMLGIFVPWKQKALIQGNF